MNTKNCTTHHHACNCREAAIAELIEKSDWLMETYVSVSETYSAIGPDYEEVSKIRMLIEKIKGRKG